MADTRLAVYLDGTAVGTLRQSTQGRVSFTYDGDYSSRRTAIPLSLSMPLIRAEHKHAVVQTFLAGLLPDGQPTLDAWAKKYGVSPNNPFALLRHVGRDAAGAVQILPEGEDSLDAATRQGDVEWLSDADLRAILERLAHHPRDWNPGRDTGSWSLAGAQSKVALFRSEEGRWGIPRDSTPTTHILKPSMPNYAGHHLNEHLCLSAARLLGLPAASSEILADDRVEVVISQRYDRVRRNKRWMRLHQEDLCQALSVPPERKYEFDGGPGVRRIGEMFRAMTAARRAENALRFFEYLVYNVAVCAPDAHAKNYSILLGSRGDTRVAPLYDVASILPYDVEPDTKSAMKIGSSWEMRKVSDSDWSAVATRLGIGPESAVERARQLRDDVPAAFYAAATEDSVPDSLRDRALEIADLVSAYVENRRDPWGRVSPVAHRR
jgi:serine/threonine-protein kinase HipA